MRLGLTLGGEFQPLVCNTKPCVPLNCIDRLCSEATTPFGLLPVAGWTLAAIHDRKFRKAIKPSVIVQQVSACLTIDAINPFSWTIGPDSCVDGAAMFAVEMNKSVQRGRHFEGMDRRWKMDSWRPVPCN